MAALVSDYMAFSVAGKIPACGSNGNMVEKGGKERYIKLVNHFARMAMREYGWELSDEPLYFVITLNLPLSLNANVQHKNKKVKNTMIKNDVCSRAPNVTTMMTYVIKNLKGLVYRRESQIAGLFIVKRYTKEFECLDILIGRPKNYRELINDLRNS